MKISVVSPGQVVTYEENIAKVSGQTKASKSSGLKGTSDANAGSESFAKALNTATVSKDLNTVTSYKDIFIEASRKYGVSYDLLTAMAKQESNFDPNAISRTGAQGIMQIMPETASELGLKNPFDAYENIMAGANYISQKLEEFNGDVESALAAYNAGSSVVKEYGGVPPYGETRGYVANIKQYMKQGVNVPYKNYIASTASKEELEADLQMLISELPDGQEYSALRNILAEMNYL